MNESDVPKIIVKYMTVKRMEKNINWYVMW